MNVSLAERVNVTKEHAKQERKKGNMQNWEVNVITPKKTEWNEEQGKNTEDVEKNKKK